MLFQASAGKTSLPNNDLFLENLCKRKYFYIQKMFAVMTYGQFMPRNSSNVRIVVQDFRVLDLQGGEVEDLQSLNL